jgi:glutamyl-tRNA synthetase
VHGRFAPSPTGRLHVGNLRTALVAWLAARHAGGAFTVRMEDLDRANSSPIHEREQLAELTALGIGWDGEVVRQSERFDRYLAAIERLRADGVVFECFCTRREIRDAASAPHGAPDRYPGTCRTLTERDRRAHLAAGRRPALRLRTEHESIEVVDRIAGAVTLAVDDIVVQRNDGVPAYHVAVVVDDAAQGIDEVVRADDLLGITASQVLLQRLLGLPSPVYAHVPLVVGPTGRRLAKRDGAVTLEELAAGGTGAATVLGRLAASLGLLASGDEVSTAADLVGRFAWDSLPRLPCPVSSLIG